jgi:hypothetical protein
MRKLFWKLPEFFKNKQELRDICLSPGIRRKIQGNSKTRDTDKKSLSFYDSLRAP